MEAAGESLPEIVCPSTYTQYNQLSGSADFPITQRISLCESWTGLGFRWPRWLLLVVVAGRLFVHRMPPIVYVTPYDLATRSGGTETRPTPNNDWRTTFMKVIMVMFDSLNRRMLPPYGCEWVHALIRAACRAHRCF